MIRYVIPISVDEILSTGASEEGHTATSRRILCPEYARLVESGVRRKRFETPISLEPDYLAWGSIIHAIRAVRIVHGHPRALQLISDLDLCNEDKIKLLTMWKVYESLFPVAEEAYAPQGLPWPFRYLGIETEVWTDLGDGYGGPLLKSVRYDSVIAPLDGSGVVYSFECKTSSRSGQGALAAYRTQFATQTTIWNRNEALVAKYGPMKGVIADMIVKTEVPKIDRLGPFYCGELWEQRITEFNRLISPNPQRSQVVLRPNLDGTYPRFLTACFGKYRPCEFLDYCWEDAQGAYEVRRKI